METCSACGFWKKPGEEENISFHIWVKHFDLQYLSRLGFKTSEENFIRNTRNVYYIVLRNIILDSKMLTVCWQIGNKFNQIFKSIAICVYIVRQQILSYFWWQFVDIVRYYRLCVEFVAFVPKIGSRLCLQSVSASLAI